MDLELLEAKIDRGETLRVTYKYPSDRPGSPYATRTDRLLDVERERERLFVSFRGEKPVWIEKHEVIGIESSI